MNVYVDLTNEFNQQKLCAILSSGQAVVLHRLAVMSKDGDWILKESDEALAHTLAVLAKHGAHYRFGAPLDLRWMSGGWSSHFEFSSQSLRIRTDFVTRPPRLSQNDVEALWKEQQNSAFPLIDIRRLAEVKKTNREKDYAIIGELARLLTNPHNQILLSRSARDLLEFGSKYPEAVRELAHQRPVLLAISEGEAQLEKALDAERRQLMHVNEARLQGYIKASQEWASVWPEIAKTTSNMPLADAHSVITQKAETILPFRPAEVG